MQLQHSNRVEMYRLFRNCDRAITGVCTCSSATVADSQL